MRSQPSRSKSCSKLVEKTRDGFSIRLLIASCHAARCDLDEGDEVWVVERVGRTSVKRRDIGRLLRLAHNLNLIGEEAA